MIDRRARFFDARRFVVYYGQGNEEQLAPYDIVIAEPAGHDEAGVRAMRSQGAAVLAYLSILEVGPHMPMFRTLHETDFLWQNGSPMQNEAYRNRIVRLESDTVRTLLLRQAEMLLQQYDGLFLDTAADLEYLPFTAENRAQTVEALLLFLKTLRRHFPGCLLVQNNGLLGLHRHTASLVDGFTCENLLPLPGSYYRPVRFFQAAHLKRTLRSLRAVGLQVLLLSNREDPGLQRFAGRNGFPLYVSADYTRLI
ncbi:hypothetical protein [Ethanoligenens sp.]|uniref:hypothetical protein n=1 Tax=Ethanoligenens sp. TaxID=2099655 RepID=UPI0039E88B77